MVSKQSSNAPKGPKRTRAKFPKVRTGCLTWIRHKKCDEAKPTCQRCRDYGYKCDGYDQAIQPRCPKQKPQDKPKSQAMVVSKQGTDLLQTFNTLGEVYGSHTEKSLFFHVNHCTVKDLIGYSPSLSSFWHDYVLPIGHAISPVRHALISLGASHKAFLLRNNPNVLSTEKQSYDSFAIQQYNKAIAGLTPIMADPSSIDVQAILICCLIFVCIDNLNGRNAVALRHLRAGSHLLGSLQDPSSASMADTEGGETEGGGEGRDCSPPGQLTKQSCDFDTLCGLSDMFERLGLDTSILIEDRLIHHHKFSSPTDDPTQGPFLSSSTARHELRRIDVDFHNFWFPPDGDSLCASTEDCESAEAEAERWAERCAELEKDPKYQELCDRFDRWVSRFDQYFESLNHTPVPEAEFKEAMVLSLQKKVWVAMLNESPCCDAALDRPYFEDILLQTDLVMPIVGGATHPVFSFEADIVPPVAFVASCCQDKDLRIRAIAMLRSINRIEGAWDSQRLADLYEVDLVTGKCHGEAKLFENVDGWGVPMLGEVLCKRPGAPGPME
ncbi:hypothetical protein J7T55_000250 [Diaporthe amygdali]|uniref:uncharacterized protein n=1 Tax=Phomopsis amygdali TaxID=1214568 RepID=UPI0022FE64A6|nr:uncharacterized protein J7T55_000250 [Diaporthe amygdali]KAJ0109325.1 hypothetical protein J7T55_000250 [Diaporthe amygdali]